MNGAIASVALTNGKLEDSRLEALKRDIFVEIF